uniref:Peptidase S54 rhomboid domain-containing protein n=1 Tax=Aureoumbra lagunensis TaxID=44058 RepID=A0A6S8DHI7_9STRA|mmetsp:Transcript_23829/g.31016  ORF Transcript_23829/g.31016 Transcript_23829/m.31016 type:complete len:892 (+) Transcript_23829:85-2760(+)
MDEGKEPQHEDGDHVNVDINQEEEEEVTVEMKDGVEPVLGGGSLGGVDYYDEEGPGDGGSEYSTPQMKKKSAFSMDDGQTTGGFRESNTRPSELSASNTSRRMQRLNSVVAVNKDAIHANEYTRLVEGKTMAFHRRLERGKGLIMHVPSYSKNVKDRRGFPPWTRFEAVSTSYTLDIVMSAGSGLCWWRALDFGPRELLKTKGLTHCFALRELLDVGFVVGDATERTFYVRLRRAEQVTDFTGMSLFRGSRDVSNIDQGDENFELIFTAATPSLCAEFVDGFDLLRKHHSQIFFSREQTSVIRQVAANPESLREVATMAATVTADDPLHENDSGPPLDDEDDGLPQTISMGTRLSRAFNRRSTDRPQTNSMGSRDSVNHYRSLVGSTTGSNLARQMHSHRSSQKRPSSVIMDFTKSERPERHVHAEFTKFSAAKPLGEVDDDMGIPTFKTKQASINPTLFHALATTYEPRRHPAHQQFEQDIFAKIVEVYYEAFGMHNAKIRLPNGRYFSVPTEHFCDGVWITATVSGEDGFNPETNEYTLIYRDGPFEIEDGVERKIAKFPEGTILERVHRDDIHIDIQDQPIAGFPYFIVLITLLQIIMYVGWTRFVNKGSLGGPSWLALNLTSSWPDCRDYRRQVWRYIGYQFVHSNGAHITFNALVQLLVGTPLELVHGFYRIGLIYQLSVIIGAFMVVVVRPTDVVVGASGGVYALFGIHLGHTILNWNELTRGLLNRWTRILILAIFIGIDTAIAIQDSGSGEDNRARTSYAAHVGGFIAGLFLSIWILHELVKHPREHCARLFAGLFIVVLTCLLIAWNVVHDPPKSIFNRGRSTLYCCYQALYCSNFAERDYGRFSCTYDDDDDKFLVWRGRAEPENTFSCDQLREFDFIRGT